MLSRLKNIPIALAIIIITIAILIINFTIHSQPSQWTSKGAGGGGALFSPSFNPNNANELFVACDMSGMYRTSNMGSSWQVMNFQQMQAGSNSKMQFIQANPQLIYCINHRGDISVPSKSTDGGTTWVDLPDDPTNGDAYTLWADINNGNNLILSDWDRMWFSNNGGTTFTLKYNAILGGGCLVAGVFFDGANIFVGTNDGLLVSTNSGADFTLNPLNGIPTTDGLLSFTGAKQNGTTRFFAVTADKNEIFAGIPGNYYMELSHGIYSLDYGQQNWVLKMNGITTGTDYPFYVAMSRNNINVVYTAGSHIEGYPTVMKSTNAGTSWTHTFITQQNQNIFTGWSGSGGDRGWGYGECAMGFAVSPLDPAKVAISDFGFVHISTNSGSTWKQGYVSEGTQNPMNSNITLGKSYEGIGLENTSCWWLTWADQNNMFACISDIRGNRSTNGGAMWSFNYTGHTINTMYYTVKHPTSGIMYGGSGNMHDMYQSLFLQDNRIDCGVGLLLMSTNNGQQWTQMHNFSYMVIWLALDPTNPNRMYASVIHSTEGGVFVSNNIQNGSGSTWTRTAIPPRTEGHIFNVKVLNDASVICTYSGRRDPNGDFTPSSGVFYSTNQGTSWLDRSHVGMHYWTKDIVIYPHDPAQNTWYVGVFSGWGGPPNGLGGLYRTTNRGLNWTRINNTDRVTSITFHPANPEIAYMTTEIEGLQYTTNVRAPAPAFTTVASYPFRQPERVFYNPYNSSEVWVTSFGGGIRVGSSLIGINGNSNEIPAAYKLHQNYPNPFNPETKIRVDLPKGSDVKLTVYDMLGREVRQLQNGFMHAGAHDVSFTGGDLPSGTYICRMEAGEYVSSIKLVLLK